MPIAVSSSTRRILMFWFLRVRLGLQVAVRFICHQAAVLASGTPVKTVIYPILLLTVAGSPALAGEKCDVPVSEWQPREVLESKLEADGWHVRSIKARDGCYEAVAVDARGRTVQAVFNPKTLERIPQMATENHG